MTLIDIVRWTIAIPLLLVSAFFIVTNIRILIENFQIGLNAARAPVTVVGGLTGCMGLLIMPVMSFGERLSMLWIPLVIDLGSIPFYLAMLVLALLQHVNRRLWHRQPDFIERETR